MAWINHYASGLAPAQDYPTEMAVDDLANVYVTGFSTGPDTFMDYVTIKYDAAGQEQWVARYNGPGNYEDRPNAICVDRSGNVYITGQSHGAGTDLDYATIKYDSAGRQQWVARYNGPGNGPDLAVAIAVDGMGGIYVTGMSYSPETSYDWATVKYSAAGVEEWVVRRNGLNNGVDQATGIGLVASGGVYVTGYSDGDYCTVRYDGAGVEQWVARYDGPDHGVDVPMGLAVEASGDVYVTGSSSNDIATVKYNDEGIEQWVLRYGGSQSWDRPAALALDGQGGLYITGWADNNCTTIKYSGSGGYLQWVAVYSDGGVSRGFAVGVDAAGDAYVTGSNNHGSVNDYLTLKYSGEGGVLQWVARYDGPAGGPDWAGAIGADAAGGVYVAGTSSGLGTGYDYATIRYNGAGGREWVARYEGSGNSVDRAADLAADGLGNVYLTGSSVVAGVNREHKDYSTVKYAPGGSLEWVAHYTGQGEADDMANALAVDGSGNVYVTGAGYADGTGYDFVTVKYSAAGVQEWVARYSGAGSDDEATDIAVDERGNVYVTGVSHVGDEAHEYATIKYDSSGAQRWVTRFPGVYYPWASIIATDGLGNVYVTGCGGEDYMTWKYDSEGVAEWSARYDGTMGLSDVPNALVVDAAGNVYVTGFSNWCGMCPGDYATVKYDNAGVERWVARYDGQWRDGATDIAVDDAGNVVVTGLSGSDYRTIKYDRDGGELWAGAQGGYEGEGWSHLALDGGGNVYVAGEVRDAGEEVGTYYGTVKYDGNGVRQWSARYDGAGSEDCVGVGVDREGGVYVGGTSMDWYWSRYTTVEYMSPSCVDVEEPVVAVRVSPEVLWPPNHELVRVCGTVTVSDDCDAGVEAALVSVTSNETANGQGDGETGNDIVVGDDGCFLLRAERQGGGDGRVYTIKYCATDDAGRTGCDSATVTVPRDWRGTTPASYAGAGESTMLPLPNPFRSSTAIHYEVGSDDGRADVNVYDASGRHVRTLVNGPVNAGTHQLVWDGRRDDGQDAAAGVYFLKAHIEGKRTLHRMILLR